MRYDIAAMTKRAKPGARRSRITLRPIIPTAVMAGDLFAAAYKPVIQAWQQAIGMIGARYEAALPVKDSVHDAVFDLDSILAAIEGSLEQLVISITPRLREWSLSAEKWHRGRWSGAILAGTGIDPRAMLGTSDVNDTVQAFVSRNVQLIRSVSDETRSRVSDIVLRGYASRTPLATVAKEMSEAVDLGRKRALRIASDQNSTLAARLDQARQQQAGISTYTWRHSMKRHPRISHVERNGKVFSWDDPPSDGPPGTQPFCGCRAQARISLD